MNKENIIIEKANIKDAAEIKALIDHFVGQTDLLERTLAEIYENIRDYYVARTRGAVVGCIGMHILWEDLAELKSLAVKEDFQGHGIGSSLINHCIEEAKRLGLKKVFAFTQKPDFMEKRGFQKIEKNILPPIVFNESLRCPKYPKCDCSAILKEL